MKRPIRWRISPVIPPQSKVPLTQCMRLTVASASKFIELAIKESDNNVKLIVLDKVNELHEAHEGVLEELVMEILRVLSS
jgi:hypothetical protein